MIRIDIDLDKLALTEVGQAALELVRRWIQETDAGKVWLAKQAADIGVPVQMTLPFEKPKEEDSGGQGPDQSDANQG